MTLDISPEQVVIADRGHVEVHAPGLPPVRVFSHANPALARERAEELRRSVEALIRAALESLPA